MTSLRGSTVQDRYICLEGGTFVLKVVTNTKGELIHDCRFPTILTNLSDPCFLSGFILFRLWSVVLFSWGLYPSRPLPSELFDINTIGFLIISSVLP